MVHKILITGDVDGQLKAVFGKLAVLQQKQNFAFAIVAGNLFAHDSEDNATINNEVEDLLAGKIPVPLPVYFTLGRQYLPDRLVEILDSNNGELCPNLIALGRKGRVKTSEGISIVVVSGIHTSKSSDRPTSLYAGGYTDKEALSCISYGQTDILVTSDWPVSVQRGSKIPCAGPTSQDNSSVSHLSSGITPRYHFSTSPAFYEREAFFHNTEKKPITRFLALAPYGNHLGEKWIYAFSIDPDAEPSATLPPGVQASPWDVGNDNSNNKRKLDSQQEAFNEFRFSNGHDSRQEYRGKRHKNRGPLQPAQCYFCLSNPTCEAHMIASIGNDAYITIAKGPLTTSDTYPALGIAGHLLIIPLVHAPTIASIPGEASEATLAEMTRYKSALQSMLVAASKHESETAALGSVTWEISRAGGVHNHWQFVPMPVKLVFSGAIEAAFKSEADSLDYPAFMTEEDKVAAVEEGNCLKVEIWSEGKTTKMAMPLDASFRFDLSFARRVVGKLLGLASRDNWKDCAQSKAEEEADVVKFKQLFEKHDFSLTE